MRRVWLAIAVAASTTRALLAPAALPLLGGARRRVFLGAAGGESDGAVEDPGEAARIAAFRARLMAGGLDAVASAADGGDGDEDEDRETATARETPAVGRVLVGDCDWFFARGEEEDPVRSAALARLGLADDAGERIPEERHAASAPVVLLLAADSPKLRGHGGVCLGRRSGYMMGDFPDLATAGFKLQPLLVGGPTRDDDPRRTVGSPDGSPDTGILCVHPYPAVDGSEPLGEAGLRVGGDWAGAADLVERGRANAYRFRLFAQATKWGPGDLERELAAGAWKIADVSPALLLKDRDRGAAPLPVDILERLEGAR